MIAHYITPGAPEEININGDIRQKVLNQTEITPLFFNAAETAVIQLMEEDTLSK